MRGEDIAMTIFIICIFLICKSIGIALSKLEDVKQNWDEYKCSPGIIPIAGLFGHDPTENFSECIQTMQSDYMGQLLKPMMSNVLVINDIAGGLTSTIDTVRTSTAGIVGSMSGITGGLSANFGNIQVEFIRFATNLRDTFAKLGGTVSTIMHATKGSIILTKSIWNGKPGKLVRMCFHPDTVIETHRGAVKISDIDLGDVLVGTDATVLCTMKIGNMTDEGVQKETMYQIDRTCIVSGSHLIFDPEVDNFISVAEYGKCRDTVNIFKESVPTLYCLITSNNTIPIGQHIFHDWEDIE